jgi:transcription elongation factor GreA
MASKKDHQLEQDKSSLGKTATEYLVSLTPEIRQKAQIEINKFVRWYGEERILCELSAHEVENYAEQITASTIDSSEKLEPVKTFLIYAHKKKITSINLSPHLKIKKASSKQTSSARRNSKTITLTEQGYNELKEELDTLINERPKIAEEIRTAAADKDFKENAPLDAAKEYQGQVEARIKELESTLQAAVILDEKKEADITITIGATVVITDLGFNEQLQYTLVDAREADPSKGKISIASPIGQALLGHRKGDDVNVKAPAGIMAYKIDDIITNR